MMLFGLLPSDVGGEESAEESAEDGGSVGVGFDSGVEARSVVDG